MIYLDNSATTFPKPQGVIQAVNESFYKFCANPGRSGYDMAYHTAQKVFECRKAICKLFNIDDESNVVFTPSCTQSLNTILKGVLKPHDHCIISSFEHNSVLRPLEKLKSLNITYSVAKVNVQDEDTTVDNFRKLINDKTKLIICTHASNVFGYRLPVERLCALAHRYGLLFCLDAAQSGGVFDIDIKDREYDFVCCSGHKGLYGPMGIGVMIVNSKVLPDSLIQGGTGSLSQSLVQPDFTPDKYESGTQNIHAILGLKNGVDFVLKKGVKKVYEHEINIIKILDKNLRKNKNIELYNNCYEHNKSAPVLSFNIRNKDSEAVAKRLNDRFKICVRAGLHCAPLAHKFMNTEKFGTVRASVSMFNTEKDIYYLCNALNKI